MLSKKLIFTGRSGLHAHPASKLVQLVKGFPNSKITLSAAGKCVNAASMLSVLSLGLAQGMEVEVHVDGGEEDAVLLSVVNFFASLTEA
jgi:phosphotransferase system HPr (HPr) family protein